MRLLLRAGANASVENNNGKSPLAIAKERNHHLCEEMVSYLYSFTGKYFSEALILESVNPQYDKRLFIEFPEKYKFTTCCVQILF